MAHSESQQFPPAGPPPRERAFTRRQFLASTGTAALGSPRALARKKSSRGTWISPDRGVR